MATKIKKIRMHGEIAPSVWTTRGEISMASILNCGGNQSMHFIMKKEVHKAVMQALQYLPAEGESRSHKQKKRKTGLVLALVGGGQGRKEGMIKD